MDDPQTRHVDDPEGPEPSPPPLPEWREEPEAARHVDDPPEKQGQEPSG